MVIGKISSKSQITLPMEIREATHLSPGDRISYEIKGDAIILRKFEPLDMAFHAALEGSLEEWTSPEDEKAFDDL